MPTYTLQNLLPRDCVFVKVYHGTGLAWSSPIYDKCKYSYVLTPQLSITFNDQAESITFLAAVFTDVKVRGTITMSRDPKICDEASWPNQTSNLSIQAISGPSGYSHLFIHWPTDYLNTVSISRVSTGCSEAMRLRCGITNARRPRRFR